MSQVLCWPCPVGAIDRWVDYPHQGSSGTILSFVISVVIGFHTIHSPLMDLYCSFVQITLLAQWVPLIGRGLTILTMGHWAQSLNPS